LGGLEAVLPKPNGLWHWQDELVRLGPQFLFKFSMLHIFSKFIRKKKLPQHNHWKKVLYKKKIKEKKRVTYHERNKVKR
jgi:hypothetical protein